MIPPALTELFSTVTAGSWRAGWLILALIVVRRLVRGRIPAQVWFAVWIVVALRLLLPVSLPVSWSPFNILPAHTAVPAPRPAPPAFTPTAAPAPAASVATEPPATLPVALQDPAPPVTPVTASPFSALPEPASARAPTVLPASLPEPAAAPSRSSNTTETATALWLVGVATLALARLVALARFHGRLRKLSPTADARLAETVSREARQLGGAGAPACLETDAVDAPALFGILRPRLLFPLGLASQLTDDELRLVVRHELAHWRRRDLLARTLLQAAAILHWFNPLAWCAARLARNDCELACDEFVLRRETAGGATAYGSTLLKVLGVTPRLRRRPAASVGIFESKQQLAQRVRTIAGYRAATRASLLGGIALVALLTTASLTRESRAAAKENISPAAISPTVQRTIDSNPERPQPLAESLRAYMEKEQMVPLDRAIADAQAERERTQSALREAEQRFLKIKGRREKKQPLVDLSYIASDPRVATARDAWEKQKAKLAELRGSYTDEHSRVKTALSETTQLEQNLGRVVELVSGEIEADFRAKAQAYTALATRLERMYQLLADYTRTTLPGAASYVTAQMKAPAAPDVVVAASAAPPAAPNMAAVAAVPPAPKPVSESQLEFAVATRELKIRRLKRQIEGLKEEVAALHERRSPSDPYLMSKNKSVGFLEEDLQELQKEAAASDAPLAEAVRSRGRQIAIDWEMAEARRQLADLQDRGAYNLDDLRAQVEETRARVIKLGEQRQRKKPLEDMSFIGSNPLVSRLSQDLVTSRIELATLRGRYAENHPEVLAMTRRIDQTQLELSRVLENVAAQIETEYEAADTAYQRAQSLSRGTREETQAVESRLQALQREKDAAKQSELIAPRILAASANPAPSGEFTVRIAGAVTQPGAIIFSAQEKPVLLEVIARAGGLAPNANRADLRLVRSNADGSRTTLALLATMDAFQLQAGDLIVVPEVEALPVREVSVIGAVNNPGTFVLPEVGKMSLAALLAKAGGPSRIGNLRKVRVVRVENREKRIFDMDMSGLQSEGAAGAEDWLNFDLKSGDVVFVPERIM